LNGTFLNGTRVAPHVDRELRFGDIVGLGVSHAATDVNVHSSEYFLFRFQVSDQFTSPRPRAPPTACSLDLCYQNRQDAASLVRRTRRGEIMRPSNRRVALIPDIEERTVRVMRFRHRRQRHLKNMISPKKSKKGIKLKPQRASPLRKRKALPDPANQALLSRLQMMKQLMIMQKERAFKRLLKNLKAFFLKKLQNLQTNLAFSSKHSVGNINHVRVRRSAILTTLRFIHSLGRMMRRNTATDPACAVRTQAILNKAFKRSQRLEKTVIASVTRAIRKMRRHNHERVILIFQVRLRPTSSSRYTLSSPISDSYADIRDFQQSVRNLIQPNLARSENTDRQVPAIEPITQHSEDENDAASNHENREG